MHALGRLLAQVGERGGGGILGGRVWVLAPGWLASVWCGCVEGWPYAELCNEVLFVLLNSVHPVRVQGLGLVKVGGTLNPDPPPPPP